MDPNSTADIEHNKAMEFILIIQSGLFDRHLTRILNSTTARMATPDYQHYTATRGIEFGNAGNNGNESGIPARAVLDVRAAAEDRLRDPVASYRRYYLPGRYPEATPEQLDEMAAQYGADLARYQAERDETVIAARDATNQVRVAHGQEPLDPSDPDSWPSSGLFAAHEDEDR